MPTSNERATSKSNRSRKARMTWQPTGRDAAGRWVKRYKKRRFQSAVVPCRTDRHAERAAWDKFVAFRKTVDAEIAAGVTELPDGYCLAIALQERIAGWCDTELRLLERTGEVPLLEHVGPDGEGRTPEDWREYLERHGQRSTAAAIDLRRKAASRNPPALPAEVAFPFSSDLSVELPADWDEQVAAGRNPTPPPRPTDAVAQDARRWMDRLTAAAEAERRSGPAAPADRRVGAQIDRYQAGREVKPSTLNRDAQRLAHFAAFAGDRDVAGIDAQTLEDYRRRLLGFCEPETDGGRGWSRAEAKQTLNAAKSFFRWLYRTEALDREPRNISFCKIEAPRTEPETADPALLRRVVEACGDAPVGLWILLAANLGAYGADLGTARLTELDLKTGTLTRGRTKTGVVGRWCLWDETWACLNASLRTRPTPREAAFGDLLFLNARGGPVWQVRAGKSKVDNTRSALERLRRKLKAELSVPSLPVWRRTSATLLRSGPFADVRGAWLAQAPNNVADRSYAAVPLERVVRACGWLGEQYGFSINPERLESAANS